MESKNEIQDLIESLIEGTISPKEHERLNTILKEDPEARKLYVEDMKLHSMLKWELKTIDKEVDIPKESIKPKSFPVWQKTILAAAAIIIMFLLIKKPSEKPSVTEIEKNSPLLVARITSLQNVRGLKTPNNAELGQWLPTGKLSLEQGMLEITFDSGAKAVLEGPAEFHLKSHNRGILQSGQLLASVPKEATRFTVNTPTGNIVDIGTSFGVNVDSAGETEVHVLEGLIEVTSTNDKVEPNMPLRENQALKLKSGDSAPVQSIPFKSEPYNAAAQVKEFKAPYNHVHFPMDENKGKAILDKGRGFPKSPYKGKYRTNEEATVGNWIDGKFGSALKFDGESSFAATNFPGIDSNKPRTIAFWVKIPALSEKKDAYAIISWGKKKEDGKKWVVLWNTKSGAGVPGALRVSYEGGHFIGTTDLRDGLWHHITIVYIGGEDADISSHIRLYVDGKFDGVSGSKSSVKIDTQTQGKDTVSMNIGRYMEKELFFNGSLDELYIFDFPLTPANIIQLKDQNKIPDQ